jgi:hypothetical protein
MHYQYVFKRHIQGYITKLNKDLQLAEVGTNRCVDINYGISDVNAYLTSVKEYTPQNRVILAAKTNWMVGRTSL